MNVSNFMNVASATSWSNVNRFLSSSVAPWATLILGASATALVGLGVYRWSQSNNAQNALLNNDDDDDFEKVKERVSHIYGYVFGGFAVTALAAVATHVSGYSLQILQKPYFSIPLVLGTCAALAATLWIDKENDRAKHVAWGIFNISMGMMLSPLGFINQRIVAQAAAISLGLGGALTLTAFLAPDRRFLAWEGPLMAALTSISIGSAISLFFPGSAFAYGVDRASLYGGLVIFSGLLMASTQRLMEEAEKLSDKDFDPINSSMSIYLDGMNIFLRILRIMLENQEKENG